MANLRDGALEERFKLALDEVLDNANDPNFQRKKLSITVQINFTPDEDQDDRHDVDFNVTTKLAVRKAVVTQIATGLVHGELRAMEFDSQPSFNFDPPGKTETPEGVTNIDAAREDAN